MNPLHFAVVVGINEYPGIGSLRAAHNDALEFYKWAIDPRGGGIPVTDADPGGTSAEDNSSNAALILAEMPRDATGEQAQPTREAIYAAIDRFVHRVRATDPEEWQRTRLYFYGAGHGIAPAPRDAALLAANASRRHLGRHVSCASLLEYFSLVQDFHEVVLLADCCRPSVIGTVTQMPVDWTFDPVNNGDVRKFLACGAMFNANAFEEIDRSPDECRGYFTRALIDGLRGGKGAVDGVTGRITSTCLKGYIAEHMLRATTGIFRTPLRPDFVDEGAGDILFGSPLEPTTYDVRLEVHDMATDELVILANSVEMVSARPVLRNPDRAVFEFLLPIGLYEAVPKHAPAPGEAWLFKVTEGGVCRAFR